MSGTQGGLAPIANPNSNKIITPKNTKLVQIHRDEAADGAGTYYGLTPTGAEEVIGGPGAPPVGGGGEDIWSIAATTIFTSGSADRYTGFLNTSIGSTSLIEIENEVIYNGESPLTLSNFQVKQSASANLFDAPITLTVRKNNVDTTISVTFNPGSAQNSVQQDNINTISIVPGDIISVKLSSGATAGGGNMSFKQVSILAKI